MLSKRAPIVSLLLVLLSGPLLGPIAAGQPADQTPGTDPLRAIWIRSFPLHATVLREGEPVRVEQVEGQWEQVAAHEGELLEVDAPGYHPYQLRVAEEDRYEVKLEPITDRLQRMTQISTGRQPKSVEFSHDGGLMVVAELEGTGLAVYDAATGAHVRQIVLGGTGFVETYSLASREELWLSQMIGGLIHVISTRDWRVLASFQSGGNWSKVVTATDDESLVFVSNWISEDVSVIDAKTRTVLRTFDCEGVPRGLALSEDERHIYVANYDTGYIEKHDVATGELVGRLGDGPGAKRHLVADYERARLYATDMARGTVSVYSLSTDLLLRERYLGDKLNTIALDDSGRYLFLSDRGPNNPVDYTIPGPAFGRVTVLDAVTLEPVSAVWGQNQPTGIAIDPSGRRLAFTNFLDYTMELYRFTPTHEVLLQR